MKFEKSEVLVVMALREEGGMALEKAGARVIYTGLGKVNAAYYLTKAIHDMRPKLVLNFGTAGSAEFFRGDFVAVHTFIQRDMDVQAIGAKKFETPFENTPIAIEHEVIFQDLQHAVCGTGDSFEVQHSRKTYQLVDMEAYALAKVCHFEGIPFGCVKFISDGADDYAATHWQESLASIPDRFREFFGQVTT